MLEALKKYNLKNLKAEINKYGYNYSTKDFILQTLLILVAIIFLAYICQMQRIYILILLLCTLAMIPFLIMSWFSQSYNIKKFTMLTDYLGNIIPIFMQKRKVRFTLGELYEITNGQMKNAVGKAIYYLDNTTDDADLSANALKLIEKDFPNSRVKSVHKLLVSIENANSITYKDVCQNMYEDIEKWIKRVYTFQKDLQDRRTKLIILSIGTLLMNSLFVYMYVSNEYFIGFTGESIYQISTLVFMSATLITVTVIMTKLIGEWLINDDSDLNDEYLKRQYQFSKNTTVSHAVIDILIFLICIAGGIYLFIIREVSFSICAFFISYLVISNKSRILKHAKNVINKSLTIEFPIWLREVSLMLNNYTVLNAIENSLSFVSYPMRKELKLFLKEAKKDPTSIKPYNDFLSDYDLEDARSSMKVLYAIQNVGKEDVKERISNLIVRNQELLDKSETLRNNDSISGIEALGYVPTIIFSIQMMVSMFAMFSYLMNTLSGSITL